MGINPSNFATGGPPAGTVSSVPSSATPDNDIDGDDNGIDGPDGYIISGPVNLGSGEPTNEPGLDNDPLHPDSLSNLSVDFGFWKPRFDLALDKVYDGPLSPMVGDVVSFTITVTNQGDVAARDITVTDYLPAGQTLADPDWTSTPEGATTTIAGPLEPGETTSVQIDVIIDTAGPLENRAEITDVTPLSQNGTPLVDPTGALIRDTDSTSNNNLTGDLAEDDVDIAVLNAVASKSPFGKLPLTGSDPSNIIRIALLVLAVGFFLITGARRRRMYL